MKRKVTKVKTIGLVIHTKAGREINVVTEAENAQEAILGIMSEQYYGADQDNGDTEVLITSNIDSFTIKVVA